MLRSFLAVMNVDPGFRASNLLTFQQFVPASAQHTPAEQIAFLDEFLSRLRAVQGVETAGGSTRIPLGSTQVTTMLAVEGRAVPDGKLPEVDMRRAVGEYFTAMGMPVVHGRVFTPEDRAATGGLAVVNGALAARVFPGEEAVGRRVRMGPNPNGACDDHRRRATSGTAVSRTRLARRSTFPTCRAHRPRRSWSRGPPAMRRPWFRPFARLPGISVRIRLSMSARWSIFALSQRLFAVSPSCSPPCSARSRCCSRPPAFTASWRWSSPSARTRWEFASRSARRRAAFSR